MSINKLPQWRCHKIVRGARIEGIDNNPDGVVLFLDLGNDEYLSHEVTDEFMAKHQPEVGQYFVLYEDSYQSVSPADAFLSGYTRMEEE